MPICCGLNGVTCITGRSCSVPHTRLTEEHMAINWRKDIDQALDDARAQKRHLLLDFSAAPM
jgi:hypothetical protein